MEASGPSTPWDGKFFASDALDDGPETQVRPTRLAFHEDPAVCEFMLGTVTAAVPLKIAASKLASPGSGLFVMKDVENGQELFSSQTPFVCFDPEEMGICHYCLSHMGSPVYTGKACVSSGQDSSLVIRACTGCNFARFCSKDCQKRGWKSFHKDECKILKEAPNMPLQHLITYRILFSQNRDRLTSDMGKTLNRLEDHFGDYMDDPDRADDLFKVAMALRDTSKSKLALRAIWRLVPAMMTNTIGVRFVDWKDTWAATFDFLMSAINHSCMPNAFASIEGGKLIVRSLGPIRAEEEITISYAEQIVDVFHRRQWLKRLYFFDCNCARCISEDTELRQMFDNDPVKLDVLHQAQASMVHLVSQACIKGLNPANSSNDMPNLKNLAASMSAIANTAFPGDTWPDHIDPMPQARRAMSMLCAQQKKHRESLWYFLRALLPTRHNRPGPSFVANLYVLSGMLLDMAATMTGTSSSSSTGVGAGTASLAIFEGRVFPALPEIQVIAAGLLFRLRKDAAEVFGAKTRYAVAIAELFDKTVGAATGPKPGDKAFAAAFGRAQAKLLAWAGIQEIQGIDLE